MRILRNAFHGIGSIALAAGLASAAHAQAASQTSAAAESGTDANDIVVTANKREQNLNDVGLTVTAISGETLAERRITSVQDIAAAVPGLKFAESGTGTPIYTLRHRLQRRKPWRLSLGQCLYRRSPAAISGADLAGSL